ncbi:single-stranded DNA-binding protein [Candidatus Saccharibacteria bacterium]|jgi:spoIIIJ-associated protein|nr:single-stranded DNA-binding protein [Candidatus Saccharibacteria bacterium]
MNEQTLDREGSIMFAKRYLEDILSFFGLNTDVRAGADDEVIELAVPSTYLNGFLIGQHGQTLRSLQFMVSQTLRQKNAELYRINIDIADYKRNSNEKLAVRAEAWAKEVLVSGEDKHLSPMSAADRRVVHGALTDYSELSSDSEGEGRDRHIVIKKIN